MFYLKETGNDKKCTSFVRTYNEIIAEGMKNYYERAKI